MGTQLALFTLSLPDPGDKLTLTPQFGEAPQPNIGPKLI